MFVYTHKHVHMPHRETSTYIHTHTADVLRALTQQQWERRGGEGGTGTEARVEHNAGSQNGTHRADDNFLCITFKQRNKVCHGMIKRMW